MFSEYTTGSGVIYIRYKPVMHGRVQKKEVITEITGILVEKWPANHVIDTLVLERYLGDDLSSEELQSIQVDSCDRWVLQVQDSNGDITYHVVPLESDLVHMRMIEILPSEVQPVIVSSYLR